MNAKASVVAIFFALALSVASAPRAQSIVSEDFTGTATNSKWYYFAGACLTAGTSTSTTQPDVVPACSALLPTYYYNNSNSAVSPDHDPLLVGGNSGYLGTSTAPTLPVWPATPPAVTPDPAGSGALRFTNGRPYGHNQAGAIVGPETAFPTGAGVQITFKTLTYRGNSYDNGVSGGAHATDGADGISFFLMDGSVTPTAVGAFGGSLGYSCSNGNGNGDGLVGAYLGLGIDEFGNFLNGTTNTLGVSSPQGLGDNTTTGGGRYANRIGLRGAGSISWAYLNSLYSTNPNDSTKPYYPSTLANPVCSSGTLNAANKCASCSSGAYVLSTNTCDSCSGSAQYVSSNQTCASCTTGTYNSSNQTCTVVTASSCPSGTTQVGSNCDSCGSGYNFDTGTSKCYSASTCGSGYTFNGSNALAHQCAKCTTSGFTYQAASNTCTKTGRTAQTPSWAYPSTGTITQVPVPTTTTTPNATEVAANTAAPNLGNPYIPAWYAIRATCRTGLLQNWPTATSSGGTSTATAIMDYPAIPNGWTVLPTSVGPIANEGATTRTDAVPILYNLKITQDGLLSLSYSYNGGPTTQVLTSQSITASNGPLPTSFRFGFAGSTGGGTNIHEILCFKATPAQTSNSSGSVNVYQNPTVKNGTTQLFLAYYFPSDWTGQLTAQSVGFDTTTNSVVVNTLPNWDARCVLTGVNTITGKCSTGVASQTAESPDSRVMLTWNGTTGIPFRYASLSAAQQSAMTTGAALANAADRVNYLRGDRTNEVNSSGVGEFRARDSVLGDIINSSPQWLGPPQEPYEVLSSWVDDLYPSATPPENATTRSYAAYQATEAARANIVYVGANDGFLHGFRAGALDASGNLVTSTTPNDGNEVLAYMPGTVLNNIHPVDSGGNVIGPLDYSNTQYGHNYFVDATPAVGDIFFNGKWHTWLVGGLGAGGAAIYVLNVTDPSQFSESTAAYNPLTDQGVVVGEWTPATIKCVGNSTCGANLGNTYGTPEIRRFHNGQWGAIIGNGFGSTNGTAGIYIMLFNDDGTQSIYYLGTNTKPITQTNNGIASPASLDIDLDHITDYIYAGDLQGNVWRFDVTSQNPALWAVSASSPLFTTGSGQPITTRPTVGTLKTITTSTTLAGTTLSTAPERVIIDFGTGQQIGQTLNSATQYASGQQYLYGIWDWDMGTATVTGSGWNWLARNGQQALSLTSVGPETISTSNMVEQTVTAEVPAAGTTPGYRTVSHNLICWMGDTGCTTSGYLGWYMPLPDSGEQVIYDPVLSPDGEFTVNTFVPSPSSILSCTVTPASGWSMGIQADTGAGSPTPFFAINGSLSADGIQLNGTGIPSFLSSGQAADNNSEYLITQTNGGPAPPAKVNRHVIVAGQRLNWIQRR